MKGNIPRITLFGSNSGNNLGDAAILSSILESFSKEIPDAEFYVPTTKPSFISKNYGEKYNVKAVDIMPWTGSLRFLGLPTLLALKKSDVALICDGIIFGKKLFNPAFNFLIVLIFVVPIARLLGCKVVCYSCGIGPFPSKLSEIFAKFVLSSCDLVIMRENDSKALAEEIGVTKEILVTGDAAFINPVSPDNIGREIISRTGLSPDSKIFGVNVTSYFDSWLGKDEKFGSKEDFINLLVKAIGKAKEECGFEVLLFSTHPMDEPAVNEVASRLGAYKIFNRDYLSHDIQAAMRRCGLFMGMRFHSVILASAVETPIVSLIYAPKVRGYMRLLGSPELGVELAGLTAETLSKIIIDSWSRRAEIKHSQKLVIDRLKAGAHEACRIVVERYFCREEKLKAA